MVARSLSLPMTVALDSGYYGTVSTTAYLEEKKVPQKTTRPGTPVANTRHQQQCLACQGRNDPRFATTLARWSSLRCNYGTATHPSAFVSAPQLAMGETGGHGSECAGDRGTSPATPSIPHTSCEQPAVKNLRRQIPSIASVSPPYIVLTALLRPYLTILSVVQSTTVDHHLSESRSANQRSTTPTCQIAQPPDAEERSGDDREKSLSTLFATQENWASLPEMIAKCNDFEISVVLA
ncbi:hypothetical protein V490_06232 [Pseudogymnoascus sp. VKM F-3557]|nr:hypothetical protein V490_06232 [Pseudogymnoascus sp. VKM F-3557]